jgi:hypothetical protein
MQTAELIGYLASALVFATFYMKTMTIADGCHRGMTPILMLHVALLPLNLWWLYQTRQLVKKIRLATEGDLSFDWLIPHMNARSFAAGETIFRKGESARELFLITAGTVRLTELRIEVGKAPWSARSGCSRRTKPAPPRQSQSRVSTSWRLPRTV